MEETQYSEILNSLKSIHEELNLLKKEINENEALLIDLLKKNNYQTDHIYNATIRNKSPEQQTKDFLLNIAANVVGNSVKSPEIINLNNLIRNH